MVCSPNSAPMATARGLESIRAGLSGGAEEGSGIHHRAKGCRRGRPPYRRFEPQQDGGTASQPALHPGGDHRCVPDQQPTADHLDGERARPAEASDRQLVSGKPNPLNASTARPIGGDITTTRSSSVP